MVVDLRPAVSGDGAFLEEVFATTRQDELALLDDAERPPFVRMQFMAQDRQYRQCHADAAFDVVLVDGVPAGRLIVNRSPAEVFIVDIALLPQHRNAGVGTLLIRNLLAEASAVSLPVTMHVDRSNPARRLYERLGFQVTSGAGYHLRMEWHPPAPIPRLDQPNTAS